MHYVIAFTVAVSAVLLAGCADPVSPRLRGGDDRAAVTGLARHRRTPTSPPPDSVRIPTPPAPPIYEELPPILDSGQ
jgi:hypothetical protein